MFCSQGNGGVPCAAPFYGRPEPSDVGRGLVDDQRVSRQHPDDRSRLSPPGFPCGSDEQRELSASSCRGRFALRQPFPSSVGYTPCPEGRGMPASVACQLEAFRLAPVNRFQHRPLSEERPFARAAGALLPKQPGRSRWRGCLFRSGSGQVPLGAGPHPFSGCLLVGGRLEIAFAISVRWSFDHSPSGCPVGFDAIRLPVTPEGGPSAEALGCRR